MEFIAALTPINWVIFGVFGLLLSVDIRNGVLSNELSIIGGTAAVLWWISTL